jgi:beta-galactosidase/beta-glucuronidase
MNMIWKPVPGNIMTQWAKDVSSENVWAEYPRPQMTRPDWLNLNGLWGYSIVPKEQLIESDMQGQILVPFAIESALSGVKRPLRTGDRLWYRRTFTVPDAWRGKRVLLHFGAVDWQTKVFVNDQPVGEHVGGYLPFWFDVTDSLIEGKNDLLVSVWDPTDDHWQQRGKQADKPHTIWYTAVSGIWQTVWLEPVPQAYIAGLKITPDMDAGTVRVRVMPGGARTGSGVVGVRVYDDGTLVAESETENAAAEITVPIPNPKLWGPASPHLYDLEVTAGEDRVGSYFGMRKFSVEAGRLCLNNRPLFQFGPLDQGYWPDGLYTPPTDEAMRRDIELVKGLGCNMLRKHVKVEPARYYYHCDRLGLIVWQDMPNGGAVVDEVRMFLVNLLGLPHRDRNYRRAGRTEAASRDDFRRELREMVDHLHNFACIGMWVPFNEAWGQFDATAVAKWLHEYDPSRPVDHASGWFDQGGGDCESPHIYFRKLKPKKNLFNTKGTKDHKGKIKEQRATVLSEFGGYSLKVDGHLWNSSAEFGYKKFTTPEALTEAYVALIEDELKPWADAGLSAAVYTQTTDVEVEVNGYVTYDRAVEKMDFEKVRLAHKRLMAGNSSEN